MSALLALLEASRVHALRQAVVEGLRARFPDVEVRGHPGKLDIADVAAGDVFQPPMIAVAVTRQRVEPRVSADFDAAVELAAYVVTEDAVLGDDRRLYTRDEVGQAMCDGLLRFLRDPAGRGWGLPDVGDPEDAAAAPLFTAKSFDQGTAFYAVTWRQMLYACGDPFRDMDGPPPAEFDASVLLPGDPGWTP